MQVHASRRGSQSSWQPLGTTCMFFSSKHVEELVVRCQAVKRTGLATENPPFGGKADGQHESEPGSLPPHRLLGNNGEARRKEGSTVTRVECWQYGGISSGGSVRLLAGLGGRREGFLPAGKVVYKSTPPTASVVHDSNLASLDFILDPRGSYKFIRFLLASLCRFLSL